MTQEPLLSKIRIQGLWSLENVTVELERINVLIGSNGAGKSNLLRALSLPPIMRTQALRRIVGQHGGASRLLHYGPKATQEAEIALEFIDGAQSKCYQAKFGYAATDAFVFVAENLFLGSLTDEEPEGFPLGTGHTESQLGSFQLPAASSLATLPALIARMGYFHFHDTSFQSPLRQNARQADSKYVRADGSNLAAYLYRLKKSTSDDARAAWTLLEGLVRRVAPFIKSLEPDLLEPDQGDASAVRLYWHDEKDYRFDVHDLSDGTLRAVALFAALTQPPGTRPKDEFAPDEVIVAERRGGESDFKRLNPEELEVWLEALQ